MTDKLLPIRSTPLEAALIMRASGQAPNGGDAWFGPNKPMTGVAPASVDGRTFDYGFAANLLYKPRSEQGENWIDFPTIRQLCDPAQGGLGMLRLTIETVKNQMGTMRWDIQLREDAGKPTKGSDKEAQRVKDLLRMPDGRHMFSRWRRKVLEDHLTLDHPIIYREPTKQKGIFLPRVIDGATMKLVLDDSGQISVDGKTTAFQQQLKGMPARNYTSDQIMWFPFNLLPQRAYAMGPVEQFIDIVMVALKRGLSTLSYYTEGNVPEALATCPPDWTPSMVKDMQAIWDVMMEGNLAQRRHMKFVPGGTGFIPTREPMLKSEQDEWLAKIICWCFNVTAGPLVKDQTKATAGTNKLVATEEGLIPRKEWWKELMDTVILTCYNSPDHEFIFQEEEVVDAKTKAAITVMALGGATGGGQAWMTVDEARDYNELEPMTDEQREELLPEPEPVPPELGGSPQLGPDGKPLPSKPGAPGAEPQTAPGAPKAPEPGQPTPKPAQKAQKLAKVKKINRNRPSAKRARKAIGGVFSTRLEDQKSRALKVLARLGKADLDDYTDLWDLIDEDKAKAVAAAQEALGDMAVDGADEGLDQLGRDFEDSITNQAHQDAIDWAEEHAAELVSGVDDTTKTGLQALVGKALEEGQSTADLAKSIQEYSGFNEDRAKLIANTETARADMAGNRAGWKASGVVTGKKWVLSADPCPECEENADAGTIGLEDDFPNGDSPAHPNCECDEEPVLDEED